MKTSSIKALGATVSILIAGGFASHSWAADTAQPTAERACLFASQPRDWRVLDATHLVLWGPSQKAAFLVTLFSPLQDLNFTETLAFIDDDHDGSICQGDKISIPDSHIATFPTAITSMRKITEAELLALGTQYKVKLVSDKKAEEIKSRDKQVPAAPNATKAE